MWHYGLFLRETEYGLKTFQKPQKLYVNFLRRLLLRTCDTRIVCRLYVAAKIKILFSLRHQIFGAKQDCRQIFRREKFRGFGKMFRLEKKLWTDMFRHYFVHEKKFRAYKNI